MEYKGTTGEVSINYSAHEKGGESVYCDLKRVALIARFDMEEDEYHATIGTAFTLAQKYGSLEELERQRDEYFMLIQNAVTIIENFELIDENSPVYEAMQQAIKNATSNE